MYSNKPEQGFARILYLLLTLSIFSFVAVTLYKSNKLSALRSEKDNSVLATTISRDGDLRDGGGIFNTLCRRTFGSDCDHIRRRPPEKPRPPKPPEPPDDPEPPTPPEPPTDPDPPTPPEPPTPPTPDGSMSYLKPVRISTENYQSLSTAFRTDNAPLVVRGLILTQDVATGRTKFKTEAEKLKTMSGVQKWIAFSTYKVANQILNEAAISGSGTNGDYLKSIGVTGISYNTESLLTPDDEMNSLSSSDPNVNYVYKYAQLAKKYGFKSTWAPIRITADTIGSKAETARLLATSGLSGIALQEQKIIEINCASERIAAVKSTAAKYRTYNSGFEVSVQIMPGRCLNGDSFITSCKEATGATYKYQHCDIFVNGIEGTVNDISIWASASTDAAQVDDLIQALRD